MALFYKEPTERFDYSFTWALSTSDTITTSTWSATPTGLTLENPTFTGSTTTIWISGGTLDVNYTLTNTIVTAQGRTDVQSATVRVATEIIPAAGILSSLPGGDGFDLQDAREIVEGWLGRVRAVSGQDTFPNEPYARSVVRKGAKAEIWGELLRQSGHLAADETTREEDRAEKLLKEYDNTKVMPEESNARISTREILRG